MGLAQSALILLGIGIVSSRFKAGVGLGELGMGIQTLVAAPLTGTGSGLSAFSGGLRDLAETLGDLGRGFGALFENIPKLPPSTPGNGNGQQLESLPIFAAIQPLVPDSGGSSNTLLAGGGGNVTPSPSQLQDLFALRAQHPRASSEAQYWNTVINKLTQPGGQNV